MIALVVGHGGVENDPGASNANITEYDFNNRLALDIAEKLELQAQVIYRDTYRYLPQKINDLGPLFVLELHCNAFNQLATGTEMIYYYNEEDSKRLAELLQKEIVDVLGLQDRGIKTVGDKTPDINWDERGEWLLDLVKPPSVVTEPFFIDNDADYARVMEVYDGFVDAHVAAIHQFHYIYTQGF